MTDFDVIVIGAGPAGEVLAGRTATAGLKTAIVESELVGGECSFWACIPSKALLKPMAARQAAEQLAGLDAGPLDVAKVLVHRDEAIEHLNDASQVKWLDSKDITLLRGVGRLDGERRVVVTSQDGEKAFTAAKAVVIATGSSATIPSIEGVESVEPWTSREATTATTVPSRLAVIGGGVVAVEMAQAWSSLGSQVTMLVRGDGLLSDHEPFVGELLAKALGEQEIDIRFNTSVASVEAEGEDKRLTLESGTTIECDEYLIATGRTPRTKDIGLQTVGLPAEAKPVEVDDRLAVKNVDGDWLFCIGDANGRSLLTHMGKYQGRIAAANIIGNGPQEARADNGIVPGVIFTNPEVAQVGLTKAQAEAAGRRVRFVHFDLSQTAAAWLNGDKLGGASLVIDEDQKVILGATFVSAGTAELLHSATVAIAGEVPLDRLWHAVPSFPTLSEVWLSLMEEYGY